jgi:GGDEF domain-containing protein
VARFGQGAIELSSTVTLYAGVLYSVVLPMVMLALVREEADAGLVRLATTDHLTELGNRRWFFSEGAELIAAAPGDLALLAFDIDHFKSINDRFGHATGDRC